MRNILPWTFRVYLWAAWLFLATMWALSYYHSGWHTERYAYWTLRSLYLMAQGVAAYTFFLYAVSAVVQVSWVELSPDDSEGGETSDRAIERRIWWRLLRVFIFDCGLSLGPFMILQHFTQLKDEGFVDDEVSMKYFGYLSGFHAIMIILLELAQWRGWFMIQPAMLQRDRKSQPQSPPETAIAEASRLGD